MAIESPVRYDKTANKFDTVYDSLEQDIQDLRTGRLDAGKARTILGARRTQLRTAELALAMQRLILQYKSQQDNSRPPHRPLKGV